MARNITKTGHGPQYLTRSDALELIDTKVREAIREQARDLEKHLIDIHNRLVALEPRIRPGS